MRVLIALVMLWMLPARAALPLPGLGARELPPTGFTLPQDAPPAEELSPAEAARQAQQQNGGGKVLAVEPTPGGWRVKLLKDGEVRIVFVPN